MVGRQTLSAPPTGRPACILPQLRDRGGRSKPEPQLPASGSDQGGDRHRPGRRAGPGAGNRGAGGRAVPLAYRIRGSIASTNSACARPRSRRASSTALSAPSRNVSTTPVRSDLLARYRQFPFAAPSRDRTAAVQRLCRRITRLGMRVGRPLTRVSNIRRWIAIRIIVATAWTRTYRGTANSGEEQLMKCDRESPGHCLP